MARRAHAPLGVCYERYALGWGLEGPVEQGDSLRLRDRVWGGGNR